MARCTLYHESVEKKCLDHQSDPKFGDNQDDLRDRVQDQKNLKVFGALGYAHIPNEKRRKLDAKAFKCRFMGYEDGVKEYHVMNVTTGKVQIMRTVKFMETSTSGHLIVRQDEGEEPTSVPVQARQRLVDTRQIVPTDYSLAHSQDPEEASARKKQIVASSTTGTTKR
ncbi:Integrase catalytic core protein [Phytophthora palmivora]|uniref:Integrase catalytic core protein n=1 Tax=Phytophthora palmivora TaxID=4796 RepID=A0A2P4Y9I8_9STRA|nr:Integrase catalytic core protein [Phytophthora palmivora]